MSQQPGHHIMDIPGNTTDAFENANIQSMQHNLVRSPSTSSQKYVEKQPKLDLSAPPSYEACTDMYKLPTYEEIYTKTCLDGAMSTRMPGRFVEGQPNIVIQPPQIHDGTSSDFTMDDTPFLNKIYVFLCKILLFYAVLELMVLLFHR